MELKRSHESFLPDFCGVRMVFAVVLGAELLTLVLLLGGHLSPASFWRDFSLLSLYVQWIALGATMLLCLLKSALARLSHTRAGLLAWLAVMAVALLVAWLAYPVAGTLGSPGLGRVQFIGQTLGVCAIVTAVLLRYLYEQFCQRQRQLAESLARYEALQARIRPHFLFNSMNTIANLTRADPELAEEVVQDLSDLFRASLSRASGLSTLADELELARGYLRIEAQRLGERLHVDWDLEPLPETAKIPPLVLQPLLENAVYHGIEPSAKGGRITISGRYRRGLVSLSVRNTLPADSTASTRDGNQMALDNIRQRLAAAYGDAAGLVVSRVDGDYQVRLYFPATPETT